MAKPCREYEGLWRHIHFSRNEGVEIKQSNGEDMRYSNNEQAQIESASQMRHRSRPRASKRGKKNIGNKPKVKRQIEVSISLLTRPMADSRIFNYDLAMKLKKRNPTIPLNKTNQFREEYVAQGVITSTNKSVPYTVRFVNSKTLEQVKVLSTGSRIQASGFFSERKGRTSAEFVIKHFRTDN